MGVGNEDAVVGALEGVVLEEAQVLLVGVAAAHQGVLLGAARRRRLPPRAGTPAGLLGSV